MPFLEHCSYRTPVHLGRHFQTIYPSFFSKAPDANYQREKLSLDDGDFLYLDWAPVDTPSDQLLIICHGLCGSTHRHYCLSMVHAFRQKGIPCLAWNYRGTGQVENQTSRITCNNSTDDLHRVVLHAIEKGYKRIYLSGFSMGGNLVMLYLGRERKILPPEVKGGIAICAPIDSSASIDATHKALFGIYEQHFLKKMKQRILSVANLYPGFDFTNTMKAHSFREFDNAFTAPTQGFKDAEDYYNTSSAIPYLSQIDRPTLLLNPRNDPLLTPRCYPKQAAKDSQFFYLEIPHDGGHCGFLTKKGREWWPAERALQFTLEKLQ